MSPVPKKFQNKRWSNSSIDPSKIEEAVKELSSSTAYYSCKQHWSDHAQLAADHKVVVLNIIRDIRDMLVSRFFHQKRIMQLGEKATFNWFFRERTKQFLDPYVAYHEYWQSNRELNPELRYLLTSYEYMHQDAHSEVGRMLHYCGLPSDEQSVAHAVYSTSKEGIAEDKQGKGKHLRKGVVGDYQNYFDSDMEETLASMLEERKWSSLKARMAELEPEIAPSLLLNNF